MSAVVEQRAGARAKSQRISSAWRPFSSWRTRHAGPPDGAYGDARERTATHARHPVRFSRLLAPLDRVRPCGLDAALPGTSHPVGWDVLPVAHAWDLRPGDHGGHEAHAVDVQGHPEGRNRRRGVACTSPAPPRGAVGVVLLAAIALRALAAFGVVPLPNLGTAPFAMAMALGSGSWLW